MTSTSSSTQAIFPTSLALAGGIPIHSQDLAASIIFVLLFALLLPVAVWRIASPRSRCLVLIRPTAFVVLRIATYIMRAILSEGHYSIGLFIAEQVLLSVGFIALVEPLLTLTRYHITRNDDLDSARSDLTLKALRLMRLALIAALVLGIYAGTQYGNLGNASTLKTVKACRDANTIIVVALSVLAGVIVLIASIRQSLPRSGTYYLLALSVLLSIASIYKLVLYYHHPPNPIGSHTKIAFYIAVSLPEFLATALYLSDNLNEEFNLVEMRRQEKERKNAQKTTTQRGQKGNGATAGGTDGRRLGKGESWESRDTTGDVEMQPAR